MANFVARIPNGDYISFTYNSPDSDYVSSPGFTDEDLIYSAGCVAVARYIVNENRDLFDLVFQHLNWDEDQIEEFQSSAPMHQIEELGECFFDDNGFVTIEEE